MVFYRHFENTPQLLRKSVTEARLLPSHPRCTGSPTYLWLAVLLDPAENAGGQLLKAAHRHRVAEGLEEGVHDALKDVELQLVRHLVLSLLWVVLVGPHDVLVVAAERRQSVFSHLDDRVVGSVHIMLAMVFVKKKNHVSKNLNLMVICSTSRFKS